MSFIAWLLAFLIMPLWTLVILFFKVYLTLIFTVFKSIVKICLLIAKYAKKLIMYTIRKIKERKNAVL